VTLGGEVHDGVGLVLCKDCAERSRIAKVDLFEGVIRIAFEVGKRL